MKRPSSPSGFRHITLSSSSDDQRPQRAVPTAAGGCSAALRSGATAGMFSTEPIMLDHGVEVSESSLLLEEAIDSSEALGEDEALRRAIEESARDAAELSRRQANIRSSISADPSICNSSTSVSVCRGSSSKVCASTALPSPPAAVSASSRQPSDEVAKVSGPELSNGAQYRLQSVVWHLGSNAGFGHYLADVRCGRSGKWDRFDDSYVRRVSEHTILTDESSCTGGYMYFYINESLSAQ